MSRRTTAVTPVTLTDEEKAIAASMTFDQSAIRSYEKAQSNGEAALALLKSLLARKAIPEIRLKYFTDPELFIGGRGKSRKDMWQRNGTMGDDIARHPNFLSLLSYFINGPDLPASAIAAFTAAVDDCGPVSSSDIVPLGKKARQIARDHGLNGNDAREEFYKLALDLGLWPPYAHTVYTLVSRIR